MRGKRMAERMTRGAFHKDQPKRDSCVSLGSCQRSRPQRDANTVGQLTD
jgi:hypothetical protein